MNRRENLKLLFTGSLSTGMLLSGCEPKGGIPDPTSINQHGTIGGRTPEEKMIDEKLLEQTFFTKDELKKLEILVDVILPEDSESPAASKVGVPDFLEFIMKDMPDYQTPMKGGLMWLDFEAGERFGTEFSELATSQILEIVNLVAWPEQASPEYEGGVRWFNMLRNLTCSGYFSTEAGWKYLGYVGNQPNVWDGVPQEVMDRHQVSLEEKYLSVYLKPEDRGTVVEWDNEGNIIG